MKKEGSILKYVITVAALFFIVIIGMGLGQFFEQNILQIKLVYLTIYFLITIPTLAIFLEKVWIKECLTKNNKLFTVISNVLFALFMLMTFLVAYQTYQITVDANSPRITVQLTAKDIQWGHYIDNDYYRIPRSQYNDTALDLPVYIKINNYGGAPSQIYNIEFRTKCGNNEGVLSIPYNQSTLIKPGDFLFLEENVHLNTDNAPNGRIHEILPCVVDFWIYYPNHDTTHKTITVMREDD